MVVEFGERARCIESVWAMLATDGSDADGAKRTPSAVIGAGHISGLPSGMASGQTPAWRMTSSTSQSWLA